jgi:hypothetical protein
MRSPHRRLCDQNAILAIHWPGCDQKAASAPEKPFEQVGPIENG